MIVLETTSFLARKLASRLFILSLTNGGGFYVAGAGFDVEGGKNDLGEIQVRVRGK